ncbi:hypothetical protein GCM10009720_27780 [Yaniella flava]|uniref:Uncharacterized protein n=1 Tax=Yaniella flava TaxID=287930 RepID=A0ABN2UX74_9MICC
MILYRIAHAYGNFKLFSGQETSDDYSAFLRVMAEPLLPPNGALCIIRVVLLVSVLAHIWAACTCPLHRADGGGLGPDCQSVSQP